MDLKDKYLKYKTKYLELKNIDVNIEMNDQIGGNNNILFILFNGFRYSKKYWNINNFKNKLGKSYTFNLPFFNIQYYIDKKLNKDTGFSQNINFCIKDLDYKNICEKIYHSVKKKYGNNKKYIVIGHSYGADLALLFSKLYQNECILCCCIDNAPYIMSYYEKYDFNEATYILQKYPNDIQLQKSLKYIKKDKSNSFKETDDIFTFIGYKSGQDRIKYYDKKLYVPTIFFRVHYSKEDNQYTKDWNLYSKDEYNILQKDKNLKEYIYFEDSDHQIWNNMEYTDTIIKTIKKYIY